MTFLAIFLIAVFWVLVGITSESKVRLRGFDIALKLAVGAVQILLAFLAFFFGNDAASFWATIGAGASLLRTYHEWREEIGEIRQNGQLVEASANVFCIASRYADVPPELTAALQRLGHVLQQQHGVTFNRVSARDE